MHAGAVLDGVGGVEPDEGEAVATEWMEGTGDKADGTDRPFCMQYCRSSSACRSTEAARSPSALVRIAPTRPELALLSEIRNRDNGKTERGKPFSTPLSLQAERRRLLRPPSCLFPNAPLLSGRRRVKRGPDKYALLTRDPSERGPESTGQLQP